MSFFLNPLFNIGRASGDLRRGVPVNIDEYSIIPLENLSKDTFLNFPGNYLVVPECSDAGEASVAGRVLFYDIEGFSLDEISDLLSRNDFSKFASLSGEIFNPRSIMAALRIVKKSELLPFILISSEKIDGVMDVSSGEIDEYISSINNDLYKTAEAGLNLKHAEDAKILSFRSRFTSQDHYAIVIGDISKIDIPSIRIHSSCYTGDLMASLSCDCRDQLLDTVKYMSEKPENAGIILYLMQEGRGIGLTNKIRAYKLQQQGYDTIEANNLLGFEEDERSFDSAYKILGVMGVREIKLLTNNPDKVKSLEDKGIKVSKTISLYGNINKYNRSYLATKKDRMGHDL